MNRQSLLSEFCDVSNDSEGETITDFLIDFDMYDAYFTAVCGKGRLVDRGEAILVKRVRSKAFGGGVIRLWRRGNIGRSWNPTITYKQRAPSIPLLKSHLQKSVRRCLSNEAYAGAMLLLSVDRIALLRRLLIIMIEDCCLNINAPLITWLMMAGHLMPLTEKVFQIVCGFVNTLCIESRIFRTSIKPKCMPSVREIHTRLAPRYMSSVLSLVIRKEYGGMKGDIRLLSRAVEYYYHVPDLITQPKVEFPKRSPPMFLNMDYSVIPCAHDYHCFPRIVKMVSDKTNIPRADVKTIIWTAESGLNFRKSHTIRESQLARGCPEYKKIIVHLKRHREAQERRRMSDTPRPIFRNVPGTYPGLKGN